MTLLLATVHVKSANSNHITIKKAFGSSKRFFLLIQDSLRNKNRLYLQTI